MGRSQGLVVPGETLYLRRRLGPRDGKLTEDADFRRLRDLLLESVASFGVAVHAYALLRGEIHLLLTPLDRAGPARMMEWLARRQPRHVTRCGDAGKAAPVAGCDSSLVDARNYLLLCCRYIETRPAAAGAVPHAAAYPWTSYRHNALGGRDKLIVEHPVYRGLARSARQRAAEYRRLVDTALTHDEADAVRFALASGAVLGDQAYRAHAESVLRRQAVFPHRRGRRIARAVRRQMR